MGLLGNRQEIVDINHDLEKDHPFSKREDNLNSYLS